MAAAIAGARLVRVPGAGHLANLEAPGAVNEALAAFLASLR
jgi:pimeloyl-ACP methyl ester carboxylesterase